MRANSIFSMCVCVALVFAPVTAPAAPPKDAGDEPPPTDDPELARAKELFDAGVARYTAADYEAAVDLWLQAYALIPPSYENRLILAELIYNVARAQQKWFEIDKDIKHLRQAREILDRYLDEVNELYPPEQVELEQERIQEQIDELDKRIEEWEAEQKRREAELAERMRPKFDEAADQREEKRNKAMIGAGAGLTALGAGGVGMFVTGLIMAGSADESVGDFPLEADIAARETAIARGRAGNVLMLTGALAGAVFLAAGAPLLGVGLSAEKKRKQRRADAGLETARIEHLAPLWIPGGVGVGVGGRF
jgi:tetratricopeptide (TPR) repeat protein